MLPPEFCRAPRCGPRSWSGRFPAWRRRPRVVTANERSAGASKPRVSAATRAASRGRPPPHRRPSARLGAHVVDVDTPGHEVCGVADEPALDGLGIRLRVALESHLASADKHLVSAWRAWRRGSRRQAAARSGRRASATRGPPRAPPRACPRRRRWESGRPPHLPLPRSTPAAKRHGHELRSQADAERGQVRRRAAGEHLTHVREVWVAGVVVGVDGCSQHDGRSASSPRTRRRRPRRGSAR